MVYKSGIVAFQFADLSFCWDDFDFLHHDAIQLNHEDYGVVGGLGHTVHETRVTWNLGPLNQGLVRVTSLCCSVSTKA